MTSLKQLLEQQIARYRKILTRITMADKYTPYARLEATTCQGYARYRLVRRDPKSKKKTIHYINKSEQELITPLAQSQYEKHMEILLEKRLTLMERLNRAYEDEEVQNLYEHCSSARKIFTTPLERTMEQWFAIPYKGLDYRNAEQQLFTKHGESVRSKSEKIIADRLLSYGIPYKYECPLLLTHNKLYPDFTFFNPHRQELIFWEHFGRMDDPSYVQRAIQKIRTYERSHLFLGEQLIVSFETTSQPLDEKWMNRTIEHHLKPMMGYHELLSA